MKFSIKNLLIVLAVFVIAFAAVQLTKSKGRSKSLKSELVSIDTTKVSKVEITGPNGSVGLSKEGDIWMVEVEGGKKQTREKAVENMLTSLNTIKPSRLASRKKENWKDYSVDSTGTRVKVLSGSNILTDIVLGRFGVEGQRSFHTFVRLHEDENVYVANDFMKMSVNENANDYRDNILLRLRKDSLTQVQFDYPGNSFSLIKDEKWTIGNQEADSATVAQFLSGLSYVTSKEFADVQPDFSHKVTFKFSNSDDVVIEGSSLLNTIKSSENDFEVFNDETVWEKIFKDEDVFVPTLN
jgi:hypothetical protein